VAPRLEIDRRTIRLIVIAFLLLAGLSLHRLYWADPVSTPDVLILSGHTMGTTWEIRVAGEDLDDTLRERVLEETERRLSEVDGWMSSWNPDSEISRFNALRSTEPFAVSQATAEVVGLALEISRKTAGAFDVTVGPLVAAWGFGQGARVSDPPSPEELAEIRAHVGFEKVTVLARDSEPGQPGPRLAKHDPAVTIDLSAIAKGYGVDHIARGLDALDRHDHLVEIGGELRASGERPGGGPWRVAVEKPLDEGRSIQAVVELADRSMATSGDYRSFYLEAGRRRSHTIDPRAGAPVESPTASASVIADTAVEADAWATALMVLGAEAGLPLAARAGHGALVLERDEEGQILERRNRLFPSAAPATPKPDR